MKGFLLRFVDKLYGLNRLVFFIALFLICTIALCFAVYIQFFYKYSETDPLMLGINAGVQKTDEEFAELKANFNQLFNNSIVSSGVNSSVVKNQVMKDIVFSGYEIKNEQEARYSIDAKIPTINIDSDTAKELNAQIKKDFYDNVSKIMGDPSKYYIYSVNYAAFLNNDILSIVVKANKKDGDSAERLIIKAYNYDIANKRKVSLDDLIALKNADKGKIQNRVKDDIALAFNKAKDLKDFGYSGYERDLKSNMYDLDNTDVYFLTADGYVYLVYSYGNQAYTNEIDITIF